MARVNIELSGRASELLVELSARHGRSKAETLRLAFALLIAADKAEVEGNFLAVANKDGKIEKELVLVR